MQSLLKLCWHSCDLTNKNSVYLVKKLIAQ